MANDNWAGKFELYDKANPEVWTQFQLFALDLFMVGRKRAGAKMIMERIRWDTIIKGKGDTFKINNNYAAYYARKLMTTDLKFKDFFETREVPTIVKLTQAGIDAVLAGKEG